MIEWVHTDKEDIYMLTGWVAGLHQVYALNFVMVTIKRKCIFLLRFAENYIQLMQE